MSFAGNSALEGIRVLDLTRFVAGPYCTMLLGDAGADVIKIEPLGGEESRYLGPMLELPGGETMSGYFMRFNRNKRSVSIDLRSDEGKQVLADLIANSDVLVENFRPGVLARLGFSYEEMTALNEKLVYCSISGFGHTEGPYREYPSFAIVPEVLGGVLLHNPEEGQPGMWTGLALGDRFPSALAVAGISMALVQRARTGRGCHVDMAMYDAMLSLNESALATTAMTGVEAKVGVPSHIAPFDLFAAKDGWLCIAVIGERVWERFCAAIGRDDLTQHPLLATDDLRFQNKKNILEPAISEWLATRTKAQAVSHLLANGVPSAETKSLSEVIDDPGAEARGMFVRYESYNGLEVTVPGNPIRLGSRPEWVPGHAPALGEHTTTVLKEVAKYSDDRIHELARGGIVTQV